MDGKGKQSAWVLTDLMSSARLISVPQMHKKVPWEPKSQSLEEADSDFPIKSCSLKVFHLVSLETTGLCINSVHFVGLFKWNGQKGSYNTSIPPHSAVPNSLLL